MIDILEPELVWVEGRCYRFCDNTVWSSEQSNISYDEDFHQPDYNMMDDKTCADDDDIQIDLTSNGSYKHSFYVPKAFYGFIIGYKGLIKKKIETETKTSIIVPKINSKDEQLGIIGRNRASVISCRQRLDLLIESSRNKIRFTHFVSIPLNVETIMNNYESFKEGVLSDPEHELKGISEDIFVKSKKLHLTIGMLRLLNDKEKSEAVEVLSSCIKDVIEPILSREKSPITINVQGLNYMNDDPSSISVFYGEVLKNDTLQEIADETFKYFVEKGLMCIERTERVKLHMTLMKSSRLLKKQEHPKKFDVTKILKDFKNYNFGEMSLTTMNISERATTADDGHYKLLTEINLYS